jgi:hypothetical protein
MEGRDEVGELNKRAKAEEIGGAREIKSVPANLPPPPPDQLRDSPSTPTTQ